MSLKHALRTLVAIKSIDHLQLIQVRNEALYYGEGSLQQELAMIVERPTYPQ